jgi:hypothetical protein
MGFHRPSGFVGHSNIRKTDSSKTRKTFLPFIPTLYCRPQKKIMSCDDWNVEDWDDVVLNCSLSSAAAEETEKNLGGASLSTSQGATQKAAREDKETVTASDLINDWENLRNYLPQISSLKKITDALMIIWEIDEENDFENEKLSKLKLEWCQSKFKYFQPLQQKGRAYNLTSEKQETVKELFELMKDTNDVRCRYYDNGKEVISMMEQIEDGWLKNPTVRSLYLSVFKTVPLKKFALKVPLTDRPISTTSLSFKSTSTIEPLKDVFSYNTERSLAVHNLSSAIQHSDIASVKAFYSSRAWNKSDFEYFTACALKDPFPLKSCINNTNIAESDRSELISFLLERGQVIFYDLYGKKTFEGKKSRDPFWHQLRKVVERQNILIETIRILIIQTLEKSIRMCFDESLSVFEFLRSCSVQVNQDIIQFFVTSLPRKKTRQWMAGYRNLNSILDFSSDIQLHLFSASPELFNQAETDFDRFMVPVTEWITTKLEGFILECEHEHDWPLLVRQVYVVLRYYIRHSRVGGVNYLVNIQALFSRLNTSVKDQIAVQARLPPHELLTLCTVNEVYRYLIETFRIPLRDQAALNIAALNQGNNLRAIAGFRENSMSELTFMEKQRLRVILTRYAPDPNCGCVSVEEVRNDLVERYMSLPAKLIYRKFNIDRDLPLTWCEYQSVLADLGRVLVVAGIEASASIWDEINSIAMKAYYSHYIHTAWRYLLDKNSWSYRFDDMTEGTGYSSYKEHLIQIYAFFCAASDPSMPPSGDSSVDDRILLVYREMALINRAHNYDDTRLNKSTGKNEEFDDLEGDLPSCNQGEVKRLVQSLLYYPYENLIVEVNSSDLDAELDTFIQSRWLHKFAAFDTTKQEALVNIWKDCMFACMFDKKLDLQVFNVSASEIDDFFTHLESVFSINRNIEHEIFDAIAKKLNAEVLVFQYGETFRRCFDVEC